MDYCHDAMLSARTAHVASKACVNDNKRCFVLFVRMEYLKILTDPYFIMFRLLCISIPN